MTNPYANSGYAKAMSAYQNTQDENLGPMEIILELYKGVIKFLRQAKSAYEADDLEKMCYWVDRVQKILEALTAHLDMDQGGKDAEFLQEFYVVLMARLGKVLDCPDTSHEFDQLIAYAMPVYERWYELTYDRVAPGKEDADVKESAHAN